MADIVTKAEVITLGFGRPISETRIEDGLINAIQQRYLIKVLGEEFYDDIILNPANYTTLLTYLKPIVANYIKYHLLPDIFVETSNTGLNKVPGNNRVGGTTEDLGSIRQNCLDTVSLYMSVLRKYLDDNSDTYTLYNPGIDPENRIDIAGGLIIQKSFNYDDDFND